METLEKVLVDAVKSTQQGVENAIDLVVEQMPELVNQLLLWHSVKSLAVTIIVLGVVISYFVVLRGLLKRNFFSTHRYGGDFAFAYSLIGVIGLPMCIVVISNSLDWLKILVAPKLWLIEYAASLAKSM